VLQEFFREPLTDISRMSVGLRYQLEWVRRYDIDPSLLATDSATIVEGSQIVGRITPSLTLDYRDNVLDPSRGSLHTISVDLAGPYLAARSASSSRASKRPGIWTGSPQWSSQWEGASAWPPHSRIPRPSRSRTDSTRVGHPVCEAIRKIKSAPWIPRETHRRERSRGFQRGDPLPHLAVVVGVVFVDSGAVTPEVNDLGGAAFRREWAAVSASRPPWVRSVSTWDTP